MVGLFSRFSASGRTGHRRSQSALQLSQDAIGSAAAAAPAEAADALPHGSDVAAEFKPVEHPIEPPDCDEPVKCPLPEPSILNDGQIWKERMPVNERPGADLPIMEEESHVQSNSSGKKARPSRVNHSMVPSFSAPEHNLINLLEECNVAGD
ncbi:hypothetical protein QJS10_CPA09g01566 [Acorus calamus]|uniref:Cystic fibrosis transmembrane conductance regulator n=1 Tax=Acorus calamus TaxID=4465 RepID=A0AAV9EAB3_ACOCL|nr:hypothetical protein QJS10_CPA09g01566 [Acorus calamus]